jgi:hypothetical protein
MAHSGVTSMACGSLRLRACVVVFYVEPTSETQPSWPFRSVAAV